MNFMPPTKPIWKQSCNNGTLPTRGSNTVWNKRRWLRFLGVVLRWQRPRGWLFVLKMLTNLSFKCKLATYPRNRPLRPTGFVDVEDPTLYTQSAHRWRQGCQTYAPASSHRVSNPRPSGLQHSVLTTRLPRAAFVIWSQEWKFWSLFHC
jgi:hypothetical protein